MPSPIELTLSSLLPTVSYLPPELISLSTSLLAQSRSKASTLKPEEEIGRTYACCHIACQRLGHKLALEIGKPAAPVKPKVYSKLHTYLNTILKTTSAPRTPTANRTEDKLQNESSAKTTRAASSQTIPSQKKTITPTTTTPSKKRKTLPTSPSEKHANAVPESSHTIIRLACNSASAPEAIPHVFAGLSSILRHLNYTMRSNKRRKADGPGTPEEVTAKLIPNLIIALVVVVMGCMRGEGDIEQLQLAREAGKAISPHLTGTEFEDWNDDHTEEEMLEDIARWKNAMRGPWAGMEWFQNVPENPLEDAASTNEIAAAELAAQNGGATSTAKQPAKTPLRRKEKRGSGGDDGVGAAGLLPGLGTMFQPAVDWLSEERREEYVRWKRDVLREAVVGG